jgi:predicted Rossmann fold flavoprotein
MSKKIFIIGGGASGMMAAIAAAKNGNAVTIFESNDSLGKKILITGNGRCNITNRNVSWKNYHGKNPRFAASVLAQFSNEQTIEFFEDLGLILVEEEDGRMFPRSQQAQSVIDVLEQELEKLDVRILFNQKIRNVTFSNNKFKVTTFQKKVHEADKVTIATGGRSYPNTGSTGDGYRFAKDFGHNVIKIFPASVPFRIKSIVCNKLQGIKVDATIKVFQNDKCIAEATDEVLFTHLGLSAPAILKSSREVSKILVKDPEAKLTCHINFFPEYSQDQLHKLLKKRMESHPDRMISSQFLGMLPKKVTPTILKYSDIDPEQKSHQISNRTLDKIIKLITNYKLLITGVLGWEVAQFTAGGVDVKEINSQTMESKIVPGLHFCGEIVDIDGDSGGYNLQWAWSSGFVAGDSIR